jgi:hypothetical protein
MKEALEQVVDLLRASARTPYEKQGFGSYISPQKLAYSTDTVQVCL